MTTREPLYTEQDRGELFALTLYRTWLCPCGCGYLAQDTFSDEETGPAFTSSFTACRAALAMAEAQNAIKSDKADSMSRARVWYVQKCER